MRYLRKIFENKEVNSFIDEEKQTIKELLYEVTDLGFELEIDYVVCTSNEFEYNTMQKLIDVDSGETFYGCGYIIRVENCDIRHETISIDALYNYANLLKSVADSMKTIDSHLNSTRSFFHVDQYNHEHEIYISKENPTLEDYYYLFSYELGQYVGMSKYLSDDYKVYKEGSDYYAECTLENPEPTAIKQIRVLKDFCESEFEEIKYDSFEKIDNKSFRIKNPKIKSLNFNVI